MPTIEDSVNHDMLEEYRVLAGELKLLKQKENQMRRDICSILLRGRHVGTHTFALHGFEVKAVRKNNLSFDQELVADLIASEQLTNEELRAIRTKYEVNKRNYDELDDGSALDEAIVSKPAMPTLTVELSA
jgi:hypothetical protein